MGTTMQIRVDQTLAEILEKIQREVALDMKQKYGLQEITINGTLASKVLAAKMRGQNTLNFEIKKTSLNKGILNLI